MPARGRRAPQFRRRLSIGAPETFLSPVRPVLKAFVCAVVPEASSLDEAGWTALEELIEVALRHRPPTLKRQLRFALRLIEWLPLVRYARPFTSLHPAQRARFLSLLDTNPIQAVRLGFWGLRTLALLGYYGRPEAAREIGYAADPRGWEAFR